MTRRERDLETRWLYAGIGLGVVFAVLGLWAVWYSLNLGLDRALEALARWRS